jgi:hypothetical protein
MKRRTALRTALGSIAALALSAAAFAVAPAASGAAAIACKVTYSTNDWGSGFTANLTVTNLGTTAVNGWSLTYSYSGNQRLQQGWNGSWSQSGQAVTVTNASWNGTIGAGGTVSPGANFAYSGSNAAPAGFALNGTACTGTSPTASPTPTASSTPTPTPPVGEAPALRVSGNRLVDTTGRPVTLRGVNRSGGEFACVQGWGLFDGPMDAASVAAIKSWNVNVVRIPLNEDCWLGLPNINPAYSGAAYQRAVKDYVALLHRYDLVAIVELHWSHGVYTGNSSACADVNASCQKPMTNTQYSVDFWRSVATAFKDDHATLFDLFNEPYLDRAVTPSTAAWTCWRDGGSSCSAVGYPVAGMQSMVDAVRDTGATNVILLGGLAYANDLSQWLQYRPTDPAGNLAASWHSYNFNACNSASCWNSTLAPVAAQVPLVAGEIGENDCGHSYIDTLMAWLDQHSVSYLGWTWNTWDCASGPALISSYDGTPTAYGVGLRDHLT